MNAANGGVLPAAFHDGLEEFHRYLSSCAEKPESFQPRKLMEIMDSFGAALHTVRLFFLSSPAQFLPSPCSPRYKIIFSRFNSPILTSLHSTWQTSPSKFSSSANKSRLTSKV